MGLDRGRNDLWGRPWHCGYPGQCDMGNLLVTSPSWCRGWRAELENKGKIFGFDVLAGKQWCLPDGGVWRFGVRGQKFPVSLYPLPTAAKQGISEVINDIEKKIINRTHSPHNPPVWPVPNHTRWQLAAHYGRLNAHPGPLSAAGLGCTRRQLLAVPWLNSS